MIRQKCWKCGGKGWLFNHALGIGTFGLGYLVMAVAGRNTAEKDGPANRTCPICEGKGYLDGTEGGN